MRTLLSPRLFRFAGLRPAAASLLAVGSALGLSACQSAPKPGQVSGRYIVSIGDADMTGTAFSSWQLAERDPAAKDVLTVVSLPIVEPVTPWAQVEVSNSALGPPTALAVSRDGSFAYVVESRGPAPAGAVSVDELPLGQTMTTVDLTSPLNPRVAAQTFVGEGPTSVSINQRGDLLAVANSAPRQQIVVIGLCDGLPEGEPNAWPLLGLDDEFARPTCIAWGPRVSVTEVDGTAAPLEADVLAVTLPERDEVMFYLFVRERDGAMTLAPWGRPVRVGKYPSNGVFDPSGRYFITSDLQWGRDVEGFNVGAPAGQLTVIGLGDPWSESPEHRVASVAPVGISPEGLAISPSGALVVTSNLIRSYLPDSDPRQTRGGSISVLGFDPASGQLTPHGEFAMNAMPGGITFDPSGMFVVVTQFRSFDPSAIDGELSFWQVQGGSRPTLKQADFFVGIGKGPHGVLIVR